MVEQYFTIMLVSNRNVNEIIKHKREKKITSENNSQSAFYCVFGALFMFSCLIKTVTLFAMKTHTHTFLPIIVTIIVILFSIHFIATAKKRSMFVCFFPFVYFYHFSMQFLIQKSKSFNLGITFCHLIVWAWKNHRHHLDIKQFSCVLLSYPPTSSLSSSLSSCLSLSQWISEFYAQINTRSLKSQLIDAFTQNCLRVSYLKLPFSDDQFFIFVFIIIIVIRKDNYTS